MKKLILTPSGFKHWELVTGFNETVKIKDKKYSISVPLGYRTDLASVPRIFWAIIPPFGNHSQAAVIHDYIYGTQKYTKIEADKIFLKLMLKYGTYKWKARIMFLAVVLFGGSRWEIKRKTISKN